MHPLDGPRAKVKRAKSQLVTLNKATNDFFDAHGYNVVLAEFDRKAGHYPLRVQGEFISLPDEWGVIVGEIAHNLRSALNLLIWQIAIRYPARRGGKPTKRLQFPIYLFRKNKTIKDSYGELYPSFCRNGGYPQAVFNSINRHFRARIKTFQPYHRRNGGRRSPLFLLHELNNADKHRLLSVFSTGIMRIGFSGLAGGGSKFKTGMSIYPNAKVGYINPLPDGGVPTLDFTHGKPKIVMIENVQVNIDFTPTIKFSDSCDAVERLPVISTLTNISNEVSSIIKSFANDF